ncbi:hypothetical protein Q5P01_002829 [Channa striata]|uniref:Endonuclease domain-containing 1 protein n=1 Tax=Channa striata TaxID=64152 RepID=A0AA88T448_CHASR|nr:hypothetical protein Q5P01_002829 [Channa striata]
MVMFHLEGELRVQTTPELKIARSFKKRVMMTSVKTWCLLSLSVLLLLSIAPTEAEVVKSMSECTGFLLQDPPKIPGILENGVIQDMNRYKVICQTHNDKRRFVTLYDIENKIPVFSAYKFKGAERGERPKVWMIEPELEGSNMKKQGFYNQAVDNDYKNYKDYTRGHLFPSFYTVDASDRESTFTLTNVVPQVKSFNEGSWNKMEICVKCVLEMYCKHNNVIEGYIVTGAKPGQQTLGTKKINIPSVLWSAFCCKTPHDKWIASAHWGDNTREDRGSKTMQTKTLEELEQQLNIDVFPGTQCPRSESVSEFYPGMSDECQCPAPASSAPPTTTTPTLTRHELMMLYRRSILICRNALRRRLNMPRSQSLKLRRLCLKVRRRPLWSDDTDSTYKELHEILSNSDLHHDVHWIE